MERTLVPDGKLPIITTFTGRQVNVLDPRPSDVHILDIIHGLSGQGRFANQSRLTLNVGQHSCYVGRLCDGYGWVIEAQGLFHDAPEAYLGDMPKWVKQHPSMLPFREAEDRWWWAISKAFDLPRKMHPAVKEADKLMVRFEARKGFRADWICPPGYPDVDAQEQSLIDTCFVSPWRSWGRVKTKDMMKFEARRLGFKC